ncbi:MAG: AbrB/MazE/SpoVT family DNA-binding domain-containing protein [Deltaproteobacteria bacterium]|nr:AbrB/MazE/SpoVT family DNA-binding domain-containing protein [Deltaproteobacteria bacterium]
MASVKVLPKGQITIPKRFREILGVKTGDRVQLEEMKDGVIIKKGKSLFEVSGSIEIQGNISVKKLINEARKEMRRG